MIPAGYLDRLAARIAAVRSVLCVGIDPDGDALPAGFPAGLAGIERWASLLLEHAGPSAAAVKVNVAFFEAWGAAGVAALERLRAQIPPDLPFIADAKRGDIGPTSARIAAALFDALGADAVTVNPYLGADAIAPLLDRADRFAYLLCRTSNPGAGALQGLQVPPDDALRAPAEPLALRVARLAVTWERHPGTVGLVVGATAPSELAAIRRVAPRLPFLVPGVGAQGGDVPSTLQDGPATIPGRTDPDGFLLVNVSRGIAGAGAGSVDPGAAVAEAARRWATRLQVLG